MYHLPHHCGSKDNKLNTIIGFNDNGMTGRLEKLMNKTWSKPIYAIYHKQYKITFLAISNESVRQSRHSQT